MKGKRVGGMSQSGDPFEEQELSARDQADRELLDELWTAAVEKVRYYVQDHRCYVVGPGPARRVYYDPGGRLKVLIPMSRMENAIVEEGFESGELTVAESALVECRPYGEALRGVVQLVHRVSRVRC